MFTLDALITTTDGVSAATKEELSLLSDGDYTTEAFGVSSGSSVVIICTLNNRYNVDTVNYYSSGGSVSLYYSISEDVWEELTVSSVGNKYSASISNIFPRAIKVVNEATTSNISIYELEVISNGTNTITFGNNITTQSISTISGSTTSFDMYNTSSSTKNINLFVEDNSVYVSTSVDSTPYMKRRDVLSIPYTYGWDSGYHDGTMVSGGVLVVSGTNTTGTYYTPVMDITTHNNGRVYCDGNSGIDFGISYNNYSSNKSVIGVRLSNTVPSGVWASGQLADENDEVWGIPPRIVPLDAYVFDSIIECRELTYAQFAVTLSGGAGAYVSSIGLELPLVASGILPGDSITLNVTTVTGSTGDTSSLLAWWTG